MPQISTSYACGRIGVLKRNALHRAQLERLQSAPSFEEASRVLADIGFTTADNQDFQAAADQHVRKACELIEAVTPDARITDCFLLRYDVHNLKVLLKSRQLAQKPEFLSACGTVPVEKLRHAVAEHLYNGLPAELKQAMNRLEKQIATRYDPSRVDTELDRAMYRQVFQNLRESKLPLALLYFKAKVDLQNFIILMRARNMGRDAAFFESVALPGGDVPIATYRKAFEDNDRLVKLLKLYGVPVYQAALSAAINPKKLPQMEKFADDYLYQLFKPYRYDSASMEMLIAYLFQKQREATDVRLIMAGKLNGFTPDAVEERVRALNG
ncbi:MAG TPA: V-type ATPase subunit [Candidatus Limiplasma sp.]|nr:V-type ATPase subunit [Candidatus Limiplasma sp.]HPS82257.1 V-type ATPase subunit [Candidatus Limiplasma sp.]